MKTINCQECLSEIPQEANVCKFCGIRLKGILCTDCYSYSPELAIKCKYCGKNLNIKSIEKIIGEGMEVKAQLFPTLLNLSFTPQQASFSKEKIVITSYRFFGLICSQEEIPWEKVAGFSHHSGLIWDSINIETRGQTSALIAGLSMMNGVKIKSLLQELEK